MPPGMAACRARPVGCLVAGIRRRTDAALGPARWAAWGASPSPEHCFYVRANHPRTSRRQNSWDSATSTGRSADSSAKYASP